ncbi:MAG: MFS transporter, partial [Atopobiaceae bacterium]|nr:MFS transporter [Atopobiaceae bacterium]
METNDARTGNARLDGRTWVVIVLLALVGQVAWAVENNFFNLFIQDAFGASLSDVALMVSASAATATATTLLVGTWSDRVGRRKPFVVAGTLVWGLSICAFAVLQRVSGALARDAAAAAALGITLTIAFDCLMTFFGSLANDACFNAWLTDITDDTNRGRVEGVNSAMPLLSMLVVFGGAMFLMIVGDDGSVTYDYPLFFTIIGGVVIATGIAAAALMDESSPAPQADKGYLDELSYGFRPSSVRENRLLYLVLAAYCVFACAMQVFMPYYVLYLRLPYILGESYVFVMAPCIVIAAVFTIFYGRRVDKVGFVRAIIVPLVLFLAGCAVLTFLTAGAGVFVGSMLMLS